ncbi:SRPBCC family protein [Rhodanobacter denitrificans]|uniref:SRPBCC family protein n=1 Tax=Rhodanobacter denitrificans TaxID=666685 RepID=UPI000260D541|nr:SRPBCC family protein [Rhodanobacter denitrificans]EIM02291.1 Activator of Hsp90 ATPase 1 family protein [Rhodanobacter denitrificans]UJM88691.1 SRPBCC family protein [Rhodanobacter denitrificans]
MSDRIEERIELRAPVSRVWRALTDYREFGAWFRVDLSGPFEPGREAIGHITWPGYEHIVWRAVVQVMEPQRLFSFSWHPYATEPGVDYSAEPPTLVEFHLEAHGEDTVLTLVESGFERIPASRRAEAFRMNDDGWSIQLENIRRHVEGNVMTDGHAG